MALIDLAHAIEEAKKLASEAEAAHKAEAAKVEALKAKHASELAKAHELALAAGAVVASVEDKLRDLRSSMISELGLKAEEDMKSLIMAAQKSRK